MVPHVSPAAHQRPLAQRILIKLRNSRFFTLSLLIHLLIIALFGSVVLFRVLPEGGDFESGDGELFNPGDPAAAAPELPDVQTPQPPTQVPTPTTETPKVAMEMITTMSTTPTSFAVEVAPVVAPVASASLPTASVNAASLAAGGSGNLPKTMGSRSGPGRDLARKTKGGSDKSEQAVLSGLRWLKKNQNPDGTWGTQHKGAMSGLALLAFLGHGENYYSVEFGQTVRAAVDALVKQGTVAGGRLSFTNDFADGPSPYVHGIATYALGEAYTMTKDEKIAPVLKLAVQHILAGQAKDGGWMYRYSLEVPSDTSVSGWQIQALKAAHLTGLNIPGVDDGLDKAMKNLERVFDKKNGGFGYRKPQGKYSLTGVGVLGLYVWKGKGSSMIKAGMDFIMAGPPVDFKAPTGDLYAWYYNNQAAMMVGGSAWEKWNKMFQNQITDNQSSDGSWPPMVGKAVGMQDAKDITGALYRTTLCVLMLEVYYRYLPTNN